jgi:RNA polymerase sigma factor (sigma-70 family)
MKKLTKEERDAQNKELFNKLSRLPYRSDEYILLRNEIVEFNMPLVYSFLDGNRERFESCDFTDLVQGCSIGLIKAVEKYNVDHESNVKFTFYANFWLLSYLNKTLSESRLIHISEYVYRKYICEDCEDCGKKDMVTNALRTDPLDEMYEDDYLYDEDDYPEDDYLYDAITESKPGNKYEHMELKQILSDLLSALKPRQAEIILEYFKHNDITADKTLLENIGKKYGITGNRARQIINDGLRRMRGPKGRMLLSAWRDGLYSD